MGRGKILWKVIRAKSMQNDKCRWWCHKAGFKCESCRRLDPENYPSPKDRNRIQQCCIGDNNKCQCIPPLRKTFNLPRDTPLKIMMKRISSKMYKPRFSKLSARQASRSSSLCHVLCAELGHVCAPLRNYSFACCKAPGEAFNGSDDCRSIPKRT